MMNESNDIIRSGGRLTEDDVKRKFLPFLRDFYKNRYEPMPNSVSIELDNVSKEGWVADGKIAFRKADGTPFICTFEATSRDKVDEVKFRLNTHYFRWDCLAFAAVCGAVAYGFFYETDLRWLVEMKWAGSLGLWFGAGLIGFFGWYFSMANWRKYRYIYAIQQFRQYFADEQWVAIAEDVFPAPNDPYMLELRNQCVYNGIGLAIVPEEGPVRKLIDPSRLGIFGKDRKMTEWVTRAQWYQAFSQNVSNMAGKRPKAPDILTVWWNKIFRPVHYLLVDPLRRTFKNLLGKKLSDSAESYNRFMGAQSVQKWVTILSLVVTLPLVWNVITFREDRISDLEELELRREGQNPEDAVGPQPDQEIIPLDGKPRGVPKQFPLKKGKYDDTEEEDDEEGNVIVMSGDDEVDEPAPPPRKTQSDVKAEECDVLLTGRGWLVQDNGYFNKEEAMARVRELDYRGIDCHWAAQSCIAADRKGWLIWLGRPFVTESEADAQAKVFQQIFSQKNIGGGKFWVRKLR